MNLNIAFDLDGTLITCENKQKYVLFSVLNTLCGIGKISQNKLNSWWELKRNGYSTKDALEELGFSNAVQVTDNWVKIIENFVWSNLDKPFPDTLSTLKYLKSYHDIHIIVLTARSNIYQVLQTLRNFEFNRYIDRLIVVSPFNSVEEKEHHLKIIRPLLYVGDSETDYIASTKSEVRFVGLTRGQRSGDFLQNLGEIQIEENLGFLNNADFMTQIIEEKALI